MMSQITSFTFVYSTIYSGIDQRKHQKLCITGLFTGNSRVTGEFPAQGPKMQKMFPFDDVIMLIYDIVVKDFQGKRILVNFNFYYV